MRLWPVLPAMAILYVGGTSFVEKYPRAAERRVGAARRHRSTGFPAGLHPIGIDGCDLRGFRGKRGCKPVPGGNPFRPLHPPRPAAQSGSYVKADPPARGFVLKGTVGNNVATIANNSGQKQIVKVGDRIDSAEVVSIEANKVVLKDRGGRFELLNDK